MKVEDPLLLFRIHLETYDLFRHRSVGNCLFKKYITYLKNICIYIFLNLLYNGTNKKKILKNENVSNIL